MADKNRSSLITFLLSPSMFVVWTLLATLAVATGPLGTSEVMSLPMRFVFWACIAGAAVIMTFLADEISRAIFSKRSNYVLGISQIIILAVALPPVLMLISNYAFEDFRPIAPTFGEMVLYVVLIASIVSLYTLGLRKFVIGVEKGETIVGRDLEAGAIVHDPIPRLLDRIPNASGDRIIYLKSNDHCVMVGTDRANYDLRMRLSDAVLEMEPVEGFMIHRSYWVRKDAVADVLKIGGRVAVILENGLELPASRNYRTNLEDAGLLN